MACKGCGVVVGKKKCSLCSKIKRKFLVDSCPECYGKRYTSLRKICKHCRGKGYHYNNYASRIRKIDIEEK